MSEFILPDHDPYAEDGEEQEVVEEPIGDEKPADDWRSAPDAQTFYERYADSGGAVHDYESAQGQQRAVADRDARIQQAQEKQQEFMQRDGLSELKGAKNLAEFMMAYTRAGGVASDGWTVADDATTGQLTVYEVD
jgi:hypothetical protein